MEAEEKRERRRRQRQKVVSCCKKFAAYLFSHIGLAAMVVAYSIMGGVLFQWLEASAERVEKTNIYNAKEDAIAVILEQGRKHYTTPDQMNKTTYENHIRGQLLSFQKQVIVAIRDKGWDGNDDMGNGSLQWSFAGALLYAVTVITTIGYGHVAPKTKVGRIVTILYALVGIPLTFLYLSNIGNFLADVFRLFYKKICCDVLCCKKCERKKKRERLKLRRRRELAAQRNTILGVTEGVASYGAADDTVVAITTGDNMDRAALTDSASQLGVPGGGDNYAFDMCGDESDVEPAVTVRPEALGTPPEEVTTDPTLEADESEHSLLSLVNDDLRETDILDDDTGSEGEQLINDAKPGTPNSEMHVSRTILDQLDDAKETAILESEDDARNSEERSKGHARSLEDIHTTSDTEIMVSAHTTEVNNKKLPSRSKSEKRPKKEKKRSLFSKKPKRDASKERSTSKEKPAKGKPDKALDKTQSKISKDKSSDKRKESKLKEFEKNTLLLSKTTISISDPQLAAKMNDSEENRLKKEPSRKGREKSVVISAQSGLRGRALRRSASAKVIQYTQDGSRQDPKLISHTLPKSKSFQQSDDSFVTAHGDSLSQLGHDQDGSDSEVELFTIHHANTPPNKPLENSSQLPTQVEISMDDNSVHLDDIELDDFNVLKDKLNFVDDPFDYEDDDSHDKVTVPISVCLILIASYILAGSVLFTLWEDWDLLTGSYFCFITLSTIGFGDIVPGTTMDKWDSHQKLVLCVLWLAFGLSLLAMCFNLMQEEVKEKVKWVGQRIGLLKDEVES